MSKKLRDKLEPDYVGSLIDAKHVGGGVRTVKSQFDMLTIPYLSRVLTPKESTMVFVQEEGMFYLLMNNRLGPVTILSDWVITQFGTSVNSFRPVGEWDADNDDPVLADANATARNGEFYFVKDAPTPRTVTYPNLFQGGTKTVSNGDMVVSVGDFWILVQPTNTWDSISKPQAIIDYVNGIVIAHTHAMSDVIGLAAALATKYDQSSTANHLIPFEDVSDQAIIELEFLKKWYYTKSQVQALVGMGGSGAGVEHWREGWDPTGNMYPDENGSAVDESIQAGDMFPAPVGLTVDDGIELEDAYGDTRPIDGKTIVIARVNNPGQTPANWGFLT